jgi:hypothetical protein
VDTKWFFSSPDCRVQGPFTHREILVLIHQGRLAPSTPIWPEGANPEQVTRAEEVVAVGLLPDWLDDIREMIERGPQPWPPLRTGGLPPWLDDVAQLEKQFGVREPATPKVEKPTDPQSPPVSPKPLVAVSESPCSPTPLSAKSPVSPKLPLAAPPTPVVAKKARIAGPISQGVTSPQAESVPIIRPVPPVSTAPSESLSLADSFRAAQSRMSEWLDDDSNKELVLHGGRQSLEEQPGIQSILQPLVPFGPPTVENFWKYALFLLENRRKYFLAGGR